VDAIEQGILRGFNKGENTSTKTCALNHSTL